MNLEYFHEIGFKPKTILDVGCNVGQFYHMCRIFWGPEGIDYVLIDGNENIEADIRKLHVPYHITVLSDSIKNISWYSTSKDPKCTGNSYYKENTEYFSVENLIITEKQTNTLDNMFPDGRFDLIKMDTQGSEVDIIKGGINLCKRCKYMILETSLIEYNQDSPKEDQVNEFMKSIGFSIVSVIDLHYYLDQISQRDILYMNESSISL